MKQSHDSPNVQLKDVGNVLELTFLCVHVSQVEFWVLGLAQNSVSVYGLADSVQQDVGIPLAISHLTFLEPDL